MKNIAGDIHILQVYPIKVLIFITESKIKIHIDIPNGEMARVKALEKVMNISGQSRLEINAFIVMRIKFPYVSKHRLIILTGYYT